MRLEKHDLYMSFAKLASGRSTCHNKQEGSVVLIHNLYFIGYTGNLPKQEHCSDIFKKHDELTTCNCNSAELNAIFQVIKSKIPVSTFDGASLYTTDSITLDKLNQYASAGITEVVYGKKVSNDSEKEKILRFSKFNNITLICYEDYIERINANVKDIISEAQHLLHS